ncbi:MAG: FG-GAP-like repeat-containing protein, partial [bacterium]
GGLASNNIFVFSLAINARTQAIYAGTATGVIRSTDNGETWSQASTGLQNNAGVEALAIDSQSGDIFAALPTAGLFRSQDEGSKWEQIDNGFAATAVLILPNSLILAGATDGVYLSRDNGVSWVAAGKGLAVPVIQALGAGIEGEIYACTDGGGIFRSVDLGANWTPVNQGLTSNSIRAFATNTNGEFFVGSSGVDPAANRSLGVYRSTDGAATWELVNTGLINTKILALATTNQGGLFAGSHANGIFRSLDNGKSWQQINKGLALGAVNELLISRALEGEDIYAAIEGFGLGVFRSFDNGDSWQQFNKGLENSPGVQTLAVNSKGHIWAGSNGAYVSLDNGESWTSANVGLEEGSIRSIAVNDEDHIFLAGPLSGVLRSTDGGATWLQVIKGLPNPNVSALSISASGDLFAAVDGAGLFRSRDNGENWAPSGNSLPSENIDALAISPDGVLLAMPASQGVFLSLNDGQNWQPFSDGLTNSDVLSIAFNPNGDVFAGTNGSGVFQNRLPRGAQDIFWNAPVSGNWSAPGNWSTKSIPSPNDRVFITVPGTYRVTLDADATVAGLQIGDANATASDAQTLFLNGRSLTLTGKSVANSSGILEIDANSTLSLQAQLDNAGRINWSGGTITGANKLNNFGTLSISGSADKNLRAGITLDNTGAVVWSGVSAVRSGEGAIINNLANAVFDVQSDVLLDGNFFSGDAATFFNVGKLSKSAGSGVSTFDAMFVNNGQAEWQTGRIDFPSGYTQIGGQTSLQGGELGSAAKVDIQGGGFSGTGVISGNVINAGQLDPGSPTGVLEIKGDYTQAASGTLNIEIGGTAQGVDFDLLDVSGQVALNGTLNLSLLNGFMPVPGNSYLILRFGSRSGDFASINGLDISESLRLSTIYNANDLTLVATAPGLSLSPTAIDFDEATVGELASRSITLTNSGSIELVISSTNISGANVADFTLNGGGAATLLPGSSKTLSVQFSPISEGSKTAALNILSNAPTSPDVVALAGVGVTPFAIFSQTTTGTIANESRNSTSSSWVDFDNDGDDDLFVTSGYATESNILYENIGEGAFTIANAGDLTSVMGTSRAATWGDYDNDGDADVFIANDSGENNFLYANNGDGTFSRVSEGAIANDGGFSTAASWGDFDNDGFLDLFVANRQGPNFLYKNNGAGGFEKVASGAVITDDAASMGCSWVDIDDDGDLDLFVVNGSGQNNALYRNNRDGTFTKITDGSIVNDGGFSRGSSWGDSDNDGDLDVFVANENNELNFFYSNNGDGAFIKMTGNAIAVDAISSTGSAWADFDNDGDLDLFVANTDLEGIENFVYLNDGAGNFTRESLFDALGSDAVSNGASVADFDRDGDLDLFVANGSGLPDLFYANNGSNKNWIGIDLVGIQSNRSAIGAKIRLQTISGEQTFSQMREISAQTSGGYGGQNSLRAAFGLGAATEVSTLEIEWPSGAVQRFNSVAANQFLTVTEVRQPVGNIIVEEPDQQPAGDSLRLAVIPPQNFATISGQLFYRAAGENNYQSIPLNINENGFAGTIPPIDVTIRGVQYYIVLSDGQTAITLPPTDPQNNPQFIPAQIARITTPLELTAGKYKMISAPLLLSATAIDSVLFDDYGEHDTFPRIWRLFRWQNLHYAEY